MDRRCGRTEPDPCSGSCDAGVLRLSQLQHSVQHVGSDGHLGRLKPVPVEAQRVANHPFPARNVGLDQSAPVVARGFLPTQAVVCGFMSAVAIPVILVMLSKPGFILECIFLLLYFAIIAIVLVIATLSKNPSDTNLHYGD
jgi:hypothetical protein